MTEQYSYTIKLKRGYAFINLQFGKHNPHKDFWCVSRSTHIKKYYFKSLEAAKIFVEINFDTSSVQKASGVEE